MASDDEASLRKHRRSPEEGSEEGLKRRKHHDSHHRHHHSHRHRHRNRSKRESDDLPPPVTTTSSFRPDNDEKEEGEILEEEEYHDSGGTGGEDRLKKADSDIESGEIKPDEAVAEISPPKSDQATESKEEDYSYSSVAEERMNDDMARNLAVETVDQLRECSYSKGVKLLRNESDESMANENEHIDKESLRHNNSKNSSIEVEESIDFDTPSDMKAENLVSGKLDELRIGCKSSGSKEKQQISPDFYEGKWHRRSMSPWDGTLRHVNGDMDHRPYKGDPRRVGSRSPPKGTGRDKKYKRHASSRSPVARGSLYSSKHRKREDDGLKVENPRNSEQNLEKYESRRHSESIENSLANKNRSASPLNSRDKYSSMGRHSSIEKYGREVHNRNGSSSRDHAIETVSQSRDTLHDRGFRQAARSHERDYSDNGDRAKRSNSRENKKNGSDREKVGRYEKEGRCDSRNRTADVENDRASTRERERSTNYGRHFGRDERHGSLDRDRDRGRDRERESDRNRERDRDRGREREKGRDNDRDRDREMERDRISRRHKYDSFENSYGGRDRYKNSRHQKYDGTENHRDQKRSKDSTREEPRSTRHDLEERKEKLLREEDEQEDYRERVTLQLAEQEEEEVDRIKEESRKRRQAILEKYRQQQSHLQVESHSDGLGKEEKESLINGRPIEHSFPLKGADNTEIQTLTEGPENRHDMSDVYVVSSSFSVGKSPPQNGNSAFERTAGAGGLGDGTPKSERSADMFCDDIFGESPAGIRKSAKGDGLIVDRSGLHDNWDDAEGYYSYRFGEVLDGRYEVTAAHGKGVFSTVVRAKDLKAGKGDPEEVAIKIIRNNDTMYKAGLEELIILKKLVGADPEDKRHCVRFLSNFKYRNHLCLVFESLHMNLREVLKKFGRNIGLKLTAVRAYAKQLFIGLKHLRNCGVLHCDIKPDNMLVNEAKNVLKLCDFGNAMFAGKNEITPYLVSRFYRAPEIILGLPYDHPMDIWSVGCCLYELYSGKVLFPGPSNNDMLRLHMELKGSFPKKMLRKGAFTDQHFDQDLNFHATEEDPVTKKTVKRLIFNIKPKDISTLIASAPGEDLKMLASFKDLLERIFVLDPEKRLTVSQALSHPFITGK